MRCGSEPKKHAVFAPDKLFLLREFIVRASRRIVFQPRPIGLVLGQTGNIV